MNWLPGFFTPIAAWLFLLLIPLVAFYFLKLKRPRLTIPSLVLWQQVLNDQRVNSPFQRFKRNLLLLLQILLLVFLILAAMQPFFTGDRSRASRIPVLIDTSASMAALDGPGGTSRLDEAKARIADMIDNMLPDQEITLLTISDTARQETVFTGNKRLLKDRLAELQPSDVEGSLEDGLRMAEAIRRNAPFDELLFYSDGNFPEQAFLDLPFDIDFQKLDPGGSNIGITASSARRADNESWDVYVELRNSSEEPGTATLTITSGEGDDAPVLASKIVTVRAAAPQRFVFRVDGQDSGLLHFSLSPETFDSLAADNIAYLKLQQSRPLNVFVPENFHAVRHALRSIPDAAVFPTEVETKQPDAFDLVISNRPDDAGIPAAIRCIFGSIPEDLEDLISVKKGENEIIDWQRDSPFFEHVNLRETILLEQTVTAEDVDNLSFAERGYRVLIEGKQAPLMLEKETVDGREVRALFDPNRSMLPYRVAFPIFITNLVNESLLATGLAETKAHPTGVLASLPMAPGSDATVISPDGKRSSAVADESGQLSGIVARRAGRYTVRAGGDVHILSASLVSPVESQLKSVDAIQFNEFSIAASDENAAETDKPLWRYLAIAALVLLFVEWWYFQKRPFSLAAPKAAKRTARAKA